jgi:hypothetical protein
MNQLNPLFHPHSKERLQLKMIIQISLRGDFRAVILRLLAKTQIEEFFYARKF